MTSETRDRTVELTWHCSDRHLETSRSNGGSAAAADGAGGASAADERPTTGRRDGPLDPLWWRIVTGQSLGWRFRRLRNRLRARRRRLARSALRRMQTSRALRRARQRDPFVARVRAIVSGSGRRIRVAPELAVPVSIRTAPDDAGALDVTPLVAASVPSATAVVDLTPAGPLHGRLELAGTRRPVSYTLRAEDGDRWLAAHLPHVHSPCGFTPRGTAAVVRVHQVATRADSVRGRRSVVAAVRRYRAVDCSQPVGDAPTTARLIVDLAGAGAPLVATALPDDVAALLGAELSGAITSCTADMLTEPLAREQHSVSLRRIVHRHHSAYDALATIAAAHGVTAAALPHVSILMATNRPEMVEFAIGQMVSQDYPSFEILCGLHGLSLDPAVRARIAESAPNAQLIDVGTDRDLGQVLALLGERASGDVVTKWDDDDWYTDQHLRDLVAAMRYSGAGVVGKGAEFVYLSSLDLTMRRFATGAEAYSTTIAGGTLMLTRSTLRSIGGWPAGPRRVDRLLIEAVEAAGAPIYRMHGHGYLLRRDSSSANHTWQVEDDYFLAQAVHQRQGLDLEFAGVTG